MGIREARVYDLIDMDDPVAVHEEVSRLAKEINGATDLAALDRAFHITVSLFRGEHPDFEACNTGFHNLKHTTDVYLAMARILHGAYVEDYVFGAREVLVGLIGALFHDIGYLKDRGDKEGTGAKHTLHHEQRGMAILTRMAPQIGLSALEVANACQMIACTNLAVDIGSIEFDNGHCLFIGKLLATADLLAQTAERTYLEKLLYLYHELREGQVRGFDSEVDLLRKSLDFFKSMDFRLQETLGGVSRFMHGHFAERWKLPGNLYQHAIDNHRAYLDKILAEPEDDPREYLKRGSIVDKVRREFGSDETTK